MIPAESVSGLTEGKPDERMASLKMQWFVVLFAVLGVVLHWGSLAYGRMDVDTPFGRISATLIIAPFGWDLVILSMWWFHRHVLRFRRRD